MNRLKEEEEISLVNKNSEVLVLKRPRELICWKDTEQEDADVNERFKKQKSCDQEGEMEGVMCSRGRVEDEGADLEMEDNSALHSETEDFTAKEAGLPMPPTSP